MNIRKEALIKVISMLEDEQKKLQREVSDNKWKMKELARNQTVAKMRLQTNYVLLSEFKNKGVSK